MATISLSAVASVSEDYVLQVKDPLETVENKIDASLIIALSNATFLGVVSFNCDPSLTLPKGFSMISNNGYNTGILITISGGVDESCPYISVALSFKDDSGNFLRVANIAQPVKSSGLLGLVGVSQDGALAILDDAGNEIIDDNGNLVFSFIKPDPLTDINGFAIVDINGNTLNKG